MNKKLLTTAITLLLCMEIQPHAHADTTDGLVAHWSFDDCTAKDNSGNGHDGSINGNPQCVEGVRGKAFSFDGSSYITTGYQQTNVTVYSISTWVKLTQNENNGGMLPILQGRGAEFRGGKGLFLGIYEDSTIDFAVHSDYLLVGQDLHASIMNSQWHQIVGIYSSTAGKATEPEQFTIYLDGIKQTSEPIRYTERGNATAPLTGIDNATIGYYEAWNSFFKGQLDDLRIYNRALSEAEIKALYNDTQGISGNINGVQKYNAVCKNLKTQQSKKIAVTDGAKPWNCMAAGLKAKKGEQVNISITAVVK